MLQVLRKLRRKVQDLHSSLLKDALGLQSAKFTDGQPDVSSNNQDDCGPFLTYLLAKVAQDQEIKLPMHPLSEDQSKKLGKRFRTEFAKPIPKIRDLDEAVAREWEEAYAQAIQATAKANITAIVHHQPTLAREINAQDQKIEELDSRVMHSDFSSQTNYSTERPQ